MTYNNHPVFANDKTTQLSLTGVEIGVVLAMRAREGLFSTGSTGAEYRSGDENHCYPTLADRIYRTRRARDTLFGGSIFADPAWDILLDVYARTQQDQLVSISSACHAAGVPESTALRYLAVLIEKGYITRSAHPEDGRSSTVEMTDLGTSLMTKWLGGFKGLLRA